MNDTGLCDKRCCFWRWSASSLLWNGRSHAHSKAHRRPQRMVPSCRSRPPRRRASPGPTFQESTMKWRKDPERLKPGAPNVLIVLIDDVGFGVPDTFGGEVHTPTLTRMRDSGISYNAFHTTSICSPTRAALLTGRNHHRVGNGTIAERASDFDGYTGIIPKTSATIAETLHHYGYKSAAFGKWHNTPANQTTAMGPFDRWPTGHGFDYFYGFLAGETSQWEPRLYENLNAIEPPHSEKYHLTEDMVEKALAWLKRHQAFSPDKPFLMYWAPEAPHGPHHVFPEWADKYKGKFDDGWDASASAFSSGRRRWAGSRRLRTHAPSRDNGLVGEHPGSRAAIPAAADGSVRRVRRAHRCAGRQARRWARAAWRSRQHHRPLHLGRQRLERRRAEGERQRAARPEQHPEHDRAADRGDDEIGGLPVLGGPKVDNMYHAGWAWAGSTPFRSTKLVAAHFGGTRNPMVISWPKGIKPDKTPRSQFHHVNDIVPTLYEVIGIKHPEGVNGFKQDPIDGVSMAYTFADANAPVRKKTQYFENNASRGIYHDGWFACAFGPFVPWDTPSTAARLKGWDANNDVWELYDLSNDFSQAEDLAAKEPERLAKMKELFLAEARANKVLPIGGGLWTRFHPEDVISSPYKSWRFDATTTRMPEFTAPALGKRSNHVAIDVRGRRGGFRRAVCPGRRERRGHALHG